MLSTGGGRAISLIIDNAIYNTFSRVFLDIFNVLGNGFIFYIAAVLLKRLSDSENIKIQISSVILLLALVLFVLFGVLTFFVS